MEDTSPPQETPAAPASPPEPRVSTRRHISVVWIIPLVALLAGAWLAYDAISSQGPLVTVRFKTAEGLVAGKTKVKFKDVEVGKVETIEYSDDLSHVVVKARMAKGMERYLRSETLFWVVRAQVTGGEVSGLGTIFSGAYIGVQLTKKGKLETEFEGMEKPPVITEDQQGRLFLLRADRLGSLDVGSPVYFRQIKVGQVAAYDLEDGGRTVLVKVFVRAPHHARVRENTRFWNVSGVGVSVDANGLQVRAESLLSMVLGGIAFETPGAPEEAKDAPPDKVFTLFSTREKSNEIAFTHKEYYRLEFPGSVRGLTIGAPVEFRGMTIGQVADISLEYDEAKAEVRIPVLIEVEPERFRRRGKAKGKDPARIVEEMVAAGLRAQLKTGSLLTGQTYVDLDLHPDAPKAGLKRYGDYLELPTLPTPLEGIFASFSRIMDRVDKLPLESMAGELRDTMGNLRDTMADFRTTMTGLRKTLDTADGFFADADKNTLPKAEAALEQMRATLARAEAALDPDSAMRADIEQALKELADAARSLRVLADYLERQPDALLYGKGR
ncbi:MAG: MlaD family protein [Thermodesulfobacteriota bacterium]